MHILLQDSMAVRKNRSNTKFLKPMYVQLDGVAFRYGKINDTYQGNTDLDAWTTRLEKGSGNPLLMSIYNSGMWNAGRFLYVMEATKLVAECTQNYNAETRKVEKHGRIYADFSTAGITSAFNLPKGPNVVRLNLEKLEKEYNSKQKEARMIMYQMEGQE